MQSTENTEYDDCAENEELYLWWLEKGFWCRCRDAGRIYAGNIVGKVDEQTAIVSADVFAPEKMQQLMSAPEFKQLEEEMGLEHAVYFLQPAPTA